VWRTAAGASVQDTCGLRRAHLLASIHPQHAGTQTFFLAGLLQLNVVCMCLALLHASRVCGGGRCLCEELA
jgi:hypothetical protein